MNIQFDLVLTQILGFVLFVLILRRYAWGPVLETIDARRQRIADEFAEAERRKAEADQLKAEYEQSLRTIDAQARQKLLEAVAEGQKVAAEIKASADREAAARLHRAEDDIAREREKQKELLKEQMIGLSLRAAEKILRQKLDEPAQRRLVGEFIDEVGAAR
uniref:ATP synthase subunit b n=1 Tax=Eiseniibacteriota bacterium TaxID=2212470 RepID=A0A832HYN1_UNCEI